MRGNGCFVFNASRLRGSILPHLEQLDIKDQRLVRPDVHARAARSAVVRAQTSLDPRQMIEWIPNNIYGFHAFGFKGDAAAQLTPFAEFLAKRDTILPWIAEYSPYALVTADDPPVYLFYDLPPAMGQTQENPAHSANFGVGLAEKLKSTGLDFELNHPGATNVKHPDARSYLLEKLKAPAVRN